MVLSWTLDKLGPMARSARDCEIVLGAMAGRDPLDEWSADEPPPQPAPPASAKGLRAAYVRPDFEKYGDAVATLYQDTTDWHRRRPPVGLDRAARPGGEGHAMTRCPNCGREQADAVVCRHCGIEIAPARTFWEPIVQPIRTSPLLLFWGAVLIVVALVAGWFVWSGKASSLSRSKAPARVLKHVIR